MALSPHADALEAVAVFNEIQYNPATVASPEWIELKNPQSTDVDLSGWRLAGGAKFTFPNGTIIRAGGFVVLSGNPAALQAEAGITGVLGPWTGNLSNSGETLELFDLSGRLMDEVTYNDRGLWPAGPDGSGSTLARRSGHLPGGSASSWTTSRATGGSPGTANDALLLGPAQSLFPMDSTWLYQDTSAGLASGWSGTNFSSGTGGWLSGNGVLAFEDALLPSPVNSLLATPASHPSGTYYFQKQFTFAGDPSATKLTLQAFVDDGAVIYLNGQEVSRRNLPAGAIAASTLATNEVENAALQEISLPASLLVSGTNTLSAEVHQAGRALVAPQVAGLSLVDTGGALFSVNYATQPGSTAFAKDLLGGGAYAAHTIPHLNDGLFGNANSWIGNSLDSFCGVSFGATAKTIGTVAWGRDNTGTYVDRCAGTYTLEYTTVPNPTAATVAWTQIGTVSYPTATAAYSVRHVFSFPPVAATGIRLKVPGTSNASTWTCIDELEAGPALPEPFKLMATGGIMNTSANLALGGTAFAKDVLPGYPAHTIAHLNDGFYGNPNSWIGNSATSFAGISFSTATQVGRVAWGRDNTSGYADRAEGVYTVQYTSVPNPTAATPDNSWNTLGSITVNASLGSVGLRHLFEFPPLSVTGMRVRTPSGACIDELEIYAPSAPDVVWGASLEAREILPPASSVPLVINEIGGASDAVWRVEVRNTGGSAIDVASVVFASSAAPTQGVTLPSQMLAPGALLVLDEAQLGFRPPQDGKLFIYGSGGNGLVDSAIVKAASRARDGLGRMLVPSVASFGSANGFNLTDSVIISEVMYHFPGSPEEWIELHNRSGASVDVGGWSLKDAVNFTFPAGTLIPAGGYLVVAGNAVALKTKWPSVAAAIIGNFDGTLSNRGERIALEDAVGNPVNALEYLDGGAWPALADGGGSSLELRDASADNAFPGSWAASDESGKSSWQTFSYRAVSGQTFGPSFWNELRLGLLDAGECLIDDISVIADPDGLATPLIQNGTFADAAAWRFLGNHGQSAVTMDGAAGSVLRLVATGPAETSHNHAETTFASNAALPDGQTCEVSFKARWLGGMNKLTTKGYYSRIARTTDLPIPQNLGTPGFANSRAGIVGPSLAGLQHSPVVPDVNQPVTISCQAADSRSITGLTLFYKSGTSFVSVAMTNAATTWSASVPGQPAGTVVQFYVEAQNAAGGISRLPAAGAASRALYIVDDGQHSNVPAQEIRLVMLPDESASMLLPLNLLSNQTTGGTVITNGADVFYDVGIRMQGSPAGRARDGTDYQGFNVDLNAEKLYLGVYHSIGFDRSGRSPANRRQDEIYAKHLFHRAGLPCTRDDLAWLIGPTAVYSGGAILQLNGYNGEFVDGQFGGSEGNVYNFDGTYEPTTTVNGSVESLKNPVPFTHHMTDLTDLGLDKEQYRGPFDIRAGKGGDDYAGLIAMARSMAQAEPEFSVQTSALIDTDEWMRVVALANLWGVGDSWLTGGFPHNARFFVPASGKTSLLPWDMDFLMVGATNATLNATTGNLRKLTLVPANNRAYLAHIRELCLTVFDPAYLQEWLLHYGYVAGQNYTGTHGYVTARRAFALSQLPAATPFAITTNGGANFSVASSVTTLSGNGWLDIREIRRNGSVVPLVIRWISETAWEADIALEAGPNTLTLDALGSDGVIISSASITITNTLPTASPRDFLRITEVHYHPGNPTTAAELAVSTDDTNFEFIELKNIGTATLDLAGVMFTSGIDFTFPNGTELAAGQFILVVKNVAAFQARYGSGFNIAGIYPTKKLSNSGDTITLVDALGGLIQSFTYSDAWAPFSDGKGHSLVIRNPAEPVSAWLSPAGWALSSDAGGNPGQAAGPIFSSEFALWQQTHFSLEELEANAVSSALADPGSSGIHHLVRYALGISPAQNVHDFLPSAAIQGAVVGMEFRRLKKALDINYIVESSSTLGTWTPLDMVPAVTQDNGDGTETVRVETSATDARKMLRLRIAFKP